MRNFYKKYLPQKNIFMIVFSFSFCTISADNVTVKSPNHKIAFNIYNSDDTEDGITEVIPYFDLSLILSEGNPCKYV